MATRTTKTDLELALVRLCYATGWTVSVRSKEAIALATASGVPVPAAPWRPGDATRATLDHVACYGGWTVSLNGGSRNIAGGWPSANRQSARSMLHSIRFAVDILTSRRDS